MANNILISVQGLLEGKRVRRLSLKARLYYPLLFGVSNTFARMELDYDLLADRLISFRDPDADASSIADWFREYEKNKLAFLYDGHNAGAEEPTNWAQFDTPIELRRSFASKDDNESPEPPEPAYTDWLKAVHGSDWERFHLTKYQRERQADLGGKRAEAGRKGAAATNAKRWGINAEGRQNRQTELAESANRQSRLIEVAVEGADKDAGEGEGGIEHFNLKDKTTSSPLQYSSTESGTATAKVKAPAKTVGSGDIPTSKAKKAPAATPEGASYDDDDLDTMAEECARRWGLLMQHNEEFDASKLPAKSEKLWVADFRKLLDVYPPQTVEDLIAYSQSEKQREYNWNCKVFCSGCERNLKFMSATKKTGMWEAIRDRYEAIVAGEYESLEIEFLDEKPKLNPDDLYTPSRWKDGAQKGTDCFICKKCLFTVSEVREIESHIERNHPDLWNAYATDSIGESKMPIFDIEDEDELSSEDGDELSAWRAKYNYARGVGAAPENQRILGCIYPGTKRPTRNCLHHQSNIFSYLTLFL